VTDQLEIYDPINDNWEKGSPLPIPLSAYALVAHEGKLLLFGGWNGGSVEKKVYEYDPDADQWYPRTDMPTARAYPGVGISEGKIFVLGGFDGEKALAVNEIYSPEAEGGDTGPWVAGAALPQPRYAMGVASMVDTLHVIGGVGEGGESLPSIELPAGAAAWEIYDSPFDGQWAFLGLAPIGTHLYLTGGEINGQPTANNLTYQAIYLINLPVVR
jgi:N-acetylneuraminic acid mutarotase